MKKRIIGLLGETGSGKDTFSNIIKNEVPSVLLLRFSKPLSDALGVFFDEIKKEDQQWLANNLRDRFGEDILMKGIAKKMKESSSEKIILNGIRVREEFNFIKDKGGTIIYINADPKIRWERVRERGEKKDDNVYYEKFLEIDKGRPEVQVRELGEQADIVIDNNKELKDLKKKAIEIINSL